MKVKRGDMLKDVLGTPKTRAPEVSPPSNSLSLWLAMLNFFMPQLLARRAYDHRADIYSFGLVLWEMVTRTKPFKGWKSMEKLVRSVVEEYVFFFILVDGILLELFLLGNIDMKYRMTLLSSSNF